MITETDKVLFVGASGLIGEVCQRLYPDQSKLLTPTHSEFDVSDLDAMKRWVDQQTVGINAIALFAAYTNVGEAEKQKGEKDGQCWQINVEGAKNVSKLAERLGAKLIYFSSDMVFPGRSGPYSETDATGCEDDLTWYGFTKKIGEEKSLEYQNALVVRLIYPIVPKGPKPDYLRKLLGGWETGRINSLFDDQRINHTLGNNVAKLLPKIVEATGGICKYLHIASSDLTTPYETFTLYASMLGRPVDLERSSILNVADKKRYPPKGGLLIDYSQRILNTKFTSWQAAVALSASATP